MENKITVISFIITFFIIHPINKLCPEECLIGALVLSFFISFFNLQIYRFLTFNEFWWFFCFKNSGFVFNERVESYFYDKRVASHFSWLVN
jgi:hypothetical protein